MAVCVWTGPWLGPCVAPDKVMSVCVRLCPVIRGSLLRVQGFLIRLGPASSTVCLTHRHCHTPFNNFSTRVQWRIYLDGTAAIFLLSLSQTLTSLLATVAGSLIGWSRCNDSDTVTKFLHSCSCAPCRRTAGLSWASLHRKRLIQCFWKGRSPFHKSQKTVSQLKVMIL